MAAPKPIYQSSTTISFDYRENNDASFLLSETNYVATTTVATTTVSTTTTTTTTTTYRREPPIIEPCKG